MPGSKRKSANSTSDQAAAVAPGGHPRRRLLSWLGSLALACGCAGVRPPPGQPATAWPAGAAEAVVAVQVTTYLDDELSPRLTPAGDLIYVSNQGGNRDIWMRRARGGLPRRLTSHSADDFDPDVAPDGKAIAFASRRLDAKGDIFLIGLDGSGLRRLTGREYAERQPAFLSAGRLAFSRTLDDGGEAIFSLDLHTGQVARLSRRNGFDPAPAPDGRFLIFSSLDTGDRTTRACLWIHRVADGREEPLGDCGRPEGFGAWARHQGHDWIVFTRFSDDTNADGKIDVDDRPSIWKMRFDGFDGLAPKLGPALPLTSGSSSDIMPVCHAGRVYYASRGDGDLDIWSVPLARPARQSNCAGAVEAAGQLDDELDRLFVLRRAAARAANGDSGQCVLAEAATLLGWGRYAQAAEAYVKLASTARDDDVRRRALVGHIAASMEERLPQDLGPSLQEENRPLAESLLESLKNAGADPETAGLVRADILRRVGRFTEALAALRVPLASARKELAARAHGLTGQVLASLGAADEALRSFLDILEMRGVSRAAQLEAARRAIDLVRRGHLAGLLVEDPIERLEGIIAARPKLPVLPAMARLEIADLHLAAKRPRLAHNSYRLALKLGGYLPQIASRALLSLSRMAEADGDLAEALDDANELFERFPALPRVRAAARRRIKSLAGRHADDLVQKGEIGMAVKVYRKLISQQADDIVAHRRLMELMARLGRAHAVAEKYKIALDRRPDDALALYLYGLALTYDDPPNNFRRARELVEQSLAINSQAPFAQQTLGWIDEQLARIDSDDQWLQRAADEYQAALGLLDVKANRRAEADLLLDLGNVHFALGNQRQAYNFFNLRKTKEIPFVNNTRRLVFLEQYARSAFLSDHLDQAIDSFQQAAELARKLGRKRRLPWLVAGRAAALQLSGKYGEAARTFRRAGVLYQQVGDKRRLATCRRNVAYNLYMAGEHQAAAREFVTAEDLLARFAGSAEKDSGVSVSLAGSASRAANGFNRAGELNFVHTFLGRIFRRSGDLERARIALEKKAALLSARMALTKNDDLMLDLSLANNQLGSLYLDLGRPLRAAELFDRSAGQAQAAANPQGQAQNDINKLDLLLSGRIQANPRELADRLQQALLVARRQKSSADLTVRLQNALGVAWAAVADTDEPDANRAPSVSFEDRYQQALDRLSAAATALDHSAAAFGQARAEAARLPGRRGARLAAVAGWNLSRILERQAKDSQAAEVANVVAGQVKQLALIGIGWRMAADGADSEQRLQALLRLPPKIAGTATDVMAERDRELVFEELIARAAGRGAAGQALTLVERLLGRRRLAGLSAGELVPAQSGDRKYLQGLESRAAALEKTMAGLTPEQAPDKQAAGRRAIGQALDELVRFRDRAGQPAKALRALMAAEVATPDEIAASLDPGEAIVEIFGMPGQALLFWIDRRGVALDRVAVSRPALEREVAVIRGDDPARAAEARMRLSGWLIKPLAERLAGVQSLIVVSDDLHLPLEWLSYSGKSLAAGVAVSHLYMASSLPLIRSSRALNFRRAMWIGARGSATPDIAGQIEKVFGPIDYRSGPAEAQDAVGDCGLVVWSVPATGDPRRPLLSSLAPDRQIGSLGGLSLGRLASTASRTGLWIMTGSGLDPDAGLIGAGLEEAMLGARVPAVLLAPGAVERGPATEVLKGMLAGLVEHGPGRALAQALSEADRHDSAWRELVTIQLRGDPGLEAAGRKRYAESAFDGAVRAAMGAYQRKEWVRALAAFFEVRVLAGYLGRTGVLPVVEKGIVTSAFNLSRFELAGEHEQNILNLARAAGDRLSIARAEQLLGVIESRAGRHHKAVDWLSKAVADFDAAKAPKEAAQAQATMALALEASSAYRQALNAAGNALSRFKSLGDELQLLRMTRFIGSIYLKRLYMAATAREWFEKALAIARKAGRAKLEAAVLLDQARTELAAGAYEESLGLSRSAEDASQKLADNHGLAEALLEQAKGLWYLGDYQRANQAQHRALQLSETVEDTRLGIVARSLGGLIALNMGDLDSAAGALADALERARRAGLADEEAVQLNNLGIVQRERGNLDEALSSFGKAMKIDERMKSSLGLAYDLRNIGIVEQLQGKLDQAGQHLGRALELTSAIGDKFNEVKILYGLARLEMLEQKPAPANEHARTAYDLAAGLGLKEIAWRALRTMGEVARQKGDLEKARLLFARSISLAEKMRASLKIERIRSGFLDDKYALYGDMIHLLISMGRVDEAFDYSERSRAREFLDLLSNRRIAVGRPASKKLLAEVEKRKERLARLDEDLRRLSGPQKQAAQIERARARQAYRQALSTMRESDPGLLDFVRVEPAGAKQVQAMLPADVALLSFYVTEKDTLVWLVRSDRMIVKRIDISRAKLAARVAGLRRLIEGFSPVDRRLEALYSLLVKPVEDGLKSIRVIGVLPHGSLHYLPFAALKPGSQGYLADRVRLFESPSASVLRLLVQSSAARVGPAATLVAFGDPAGAGKLADIPFAAREAQSVAVEQSGGRAYVGRAATEAELRKLAPESDIVHLACHADYDPARPLNSALLLSPGRGQDGRLSAREVLSLSLSARLVTLSACDTALGKPGSGDETLGLTRAFLSAGAGAVLSSLWRVSDVATAMLMKRFYRDLRSQPMLEALYRAQKVVRRYFPHPAYWAGFVLTGSW